MHDLGSKLQVTSLEMTTDIMHVSSPLGLLLVRHISSLGA